VEVLKNAFYSKLVRYVLMKTKAIFDPSKQQSDEKRVFIYFRRRIEDKTLFGSIFFAAGLFACNYFCRKSQAEFLLIVVPRRQGSLWLFNFSSS
jgi:hypothetical protein